MSLIPADESESAEHPGEQASHDGTKESPIRRAVGRVVRGLVTLGRALTPSFGRDGTDGDTDDGRDPPVVSPTDSERVVGQTDYESRETKIVDVESTARALPGGGRTEPDTHDSADLTARVEGGELTLENPDEPGARITSDEWTEIER